MPFPTHLLHICNKIPGQHSNSSLLKYRSSHLEVDLRLSYIAICNATLQQICQLDHWRVFSEPFSQSGTGDLLPSFSENHIANVFLGTVPKIHPFWWRHPSLILTHTSPNKHESECVNPSTFVAHYQHLGFEILLVSRKKVNRKEKNTQTIRNEITLFWLGAVHKWRHHFLGVSRPPLPSCHLAPLHCTHK